MISFLSACIITLNEEDNIFRCLQSLSFVSEIIILDSGSTDQTLSIAAKFPNVKIYQKEFINYIEQKNYCMNLARNDWILFLDADEEVSEDLQREIHSLTQSDWEMYSGFWIPRLTHYLGKWIYFGGWYPNYQMKLFRKSKGEFTGLLVHEKVEVDGKVKKLKFPILHYSYKNISDHLKFIDKYSSLFALEKYKQGKKSGVFFAFGKSIYKFLYMYFVKLGFLHGRVGFIISILGAYYNFLKYVKLFELNLTKNEEKKCGVEDRK